MRARRGARAVAVVVALAALGAVDLARPQPARAAYDGCGTTPLVAHRGDQSGGATENTLGAVRAAAARGAWFEIDLRTTSDGHVVLMHDPDVGRTTQGSGLVRRMTLRRVQGLRTDDGQRVPTVRQALRVLLDNPRSEAVLDLKAMTDGSWSRLRSVVADLGVAGRLTTIAGSDRLLARSRSVLRGVPTFRVLAGLPTPEQAAAYGGVNVPLSAPTPDWLDAVAEAGTPWNARLINLETKWERALALGSSWIMTDDVPGYQAWCSG